MTPKTPQEVREALARVLGHPPREDIWAYLMKKGFVQEVLDGYPLEDVVKEYYEMARTFRRAPAKSRKIGHRSTETLSTGTLSSALTRIAAIDAAQDSDVVTFREKVLGGRLMPLDEIAEWIMWQQEKDGEPTFWLTFPLPNTPEELIGLLKMLVFGFRFDFQVSFGPLGKLAEELSSFDAPLPMPGESYFLDVDTLEYWNAVDLEARSTPVNRKGTLGWLKRVAQKLTAKYPWWEEFHAVAFILSGWEPSYPNARGTTATYLEAEIPCQHESVIVETDPRVSPREIANLYARLRRQKMPRRRYKPITKKHASLPVFAAEHSGLTWKEMTHLWNSQYPDWAYNNWRIFARDARTAWERVTGKKWIPRNKKTQSRQDQEEDRTGKEGENRQKHGST